MCNVNRGRLEKLHAEENKVAEVRTGSRSHAEFAI